ALARQHEERLLVRLGVVEAARLAGLEDGEVDTDLREATRLELGSVPHHRHVGLEDAAMAEAVVRQPGGVADGDDEPAVLDRHQPGARVLETGLARHGAGAGVVVGVVSVVTGAVVVVGASVVTGAVGGAAVVVRGAVVVAGGATVVAVVVCGAVVRGAVVVVARVVVGAAVVVGRDAVLVAPGGTVGSTKVEA